MGGDLCRSGIDTGRVYLGEQVSLPKPYYEKDGIVIYHADCREILPELPMVDLVLTDPPYGLDKKLFQGGSRNKNWAIVKYKGENWDKVPEKEIFDLIFRTSKNQIIWGINYFSLPATRGVLVWDKVQYAPNFSQVEIAYTSFDHPAKIFKKSFMFYKSHPTQKPSELMNWCIQQAPEDTLTILDPFMGSGTTLVAAKELGRKAIGIEIEERYCEMAVRRLSQQVFNFQP